MRSHRLLLVLCFVSCGGGEAPRPVEPVGWRVVDLGPVTFAVPPDVVAGSGVEVDSTVGLFDGDGYRITFDLGRFGEDLEGNRFEQQYVQQERVVAGQRTIEVGFVPSDEPYPWARVTQIRVPGDRTLTVRVSCPSAEDCAVADQIFDSISLV